MTRKTWEKAGMSTKVALDTTATFIFPRLVREKIGWVIPSKIKVDYLVDKVCPEAPVTIFFTTDLDDSQQGYTLSHLYPKVRQTSGAKLRCLAMVNDLIAPRLALPISELDPIYPLAENMCDMFVMLNQPKWTRVEFNMSGVQSIQNEQLGVYQVLDADNKPLRIGEGVVARRLPEYLKDDRIVRLAKSARYIPVSEKANSLAYEQVFIAEHEYIYGKLPEFNRIHR